MKTDTLTVVKTLDDGRIEARYDFSGGSMNMVFKSLASAEKHAKTVEAELVDPESLLKKEDILPEGFDFAVAC